MNEELKKFLYALLKSAFGMEETDAATLFNAEGIPEATALPALLTKDASRIKALKDQIVTASETGYSKAKLEVLSKLENELKTKHGITSDKKGIELVEEIITAVAQKKSGSAVPTEAEIKAHPVYQALQLAKDNEITQIKSDMQVKIDAAVADSKKKATFDDVGRIALDQLEEMGAIESEDPKIKAFHRKTFLKELEQFTYDLPDGADPIVKKGTELHQDEHGHTIPFRKHVEAIAGNIYHFQAAEERSSGGRGAAGAGNAGAKSKIVVKKPKTTAEFQTTLDTIEGANIPAEEKLKLKSEANKLYKQAKEEAGGKLA